MSDYYADPRLSASKLKNYLTHDPAVAYWMETNQGPSSDALRHGTALHSLMEGQPLEVSPFSEYRTKEAKEYKANHPDALKPSEADMVQKWHAAIVHRLKDSHPHLFETWMDGELEQEFFTETHKCKVDCIKDGILLDWKTTRHTSVNDVVREYQRYGAAVQASLYLDLAGADEFHFVVVSKVEPHPVWVLSCSDDFLVYGRRLRIEAEQARQNYLANGERPVVTLDPPGWVDVAKSVEGFEEVEI